MSIRIARFEWDEYNSGHLAKAHPEFGLEFLEDVVMQAKSYLSFGYDRLGRKIYGAEHGRFIVLFNLKRGKVARIFSVREI
ncbi:MAG: hypothetical protein ACREOO_15710 [bacterium]